MRFRFSLLVGISLAIALALVYIPSTSADRDDCGTGYEFRPSSGVGCVQINCGTIKDAHYSYTERCICGSAGSEFENPADPNKSCNYPADYASCPGCLFACVHADEDCPDAPGLATNKNTNSTTNSSSNANTNKNVNTAANTNQPTNKNINSSNANATPPITTQGSISPTCADECHKYLRGKKNAEVLSAEGEYPDCSCQIDIRDNGGNVTQTVSVDGSIETTYTFDPSSGVLISKTIFNRKDEIEKIRKRLGYRYTEKEIDELLAPDKVDQWFQGQIKNIKTETGLLHPQFWWQHVVAMLDHGSNGNSADFVDVHEFGRCGDSMMWLERNLTTDLNLGDDADEPGQKHEAMLSITGEKYGNMLNHTSLMVRPPGITNAEWEDIVKELKNLSGGEESNPGMLPGSLSNIDPRLLDAKVLDPYKKQTTTVREFIKGWSYIRIS